MDRRTFVKSAGCVTAASFAARLRAADNSESIAIEDVFLDLNNVHKWNESNGDTWDPFWADDNNLYAFNCDGRGFGKQPRNLAFNRLSGGSVRTLSGHLINSLDDYGKSGLKGPDNATWKVCGQECIDSVFYAFVSRNVYGKDSKDPLLRQTAFHSSLIKSTDRGRTWTRPADQNYREPMWPGPAFGAPFFIHYGQNGGRVAQDGADRFVYAVSTNGFWNDGDHLILARVERKFLPRLHPADWSFYSGGWSFHTPTHVTQSTDWIADIRKAKPILSRPGKCGQTPICYIPALRRYLLISWYNTERMTKWFEPNEMRYDFFEAEHPWGPWKKVASYSDNFIGDHGHMYGPSLCARFQERRGSDVRMTMFTAGCPFEDKPAGLYKLWEIPVVLRTRALPASTLVEDDNSQIEYRGSWFTRNGVHQTGIAGDAAELTFEGTGMEYFAHKSQGFGEIALSIDGGGPTAISLQLENFPRLAHVVVFRAEGLNKRRHTIRLVNTHTALVNIEAFRVFN